MSDTLALQGAVARLRADGQPSWLYVNPVYLFSRRRRWFGRGRADASSPWTVSIGVHLVTDASQTIDPVDDSEVPIVRRSADATR